MAPTEARARKGGSDAEKEGGGQAMKVAGCNAKDGKGRIGRRQTYEQERKGKGKVGVDVR